MQYVSAHLLIFQAPEHPLEVAQYLKREVQTRCRGFKGPVPPPLAIRKYMIQLLKMNDW